LFLPSSLNVFIVVYIATPNIYPPRVKLWFSYREQFLFFLFIFAIMKYGLV